MSLQVWLPLNGDLENKGLSDVSVTNNGATINNNGKIGKCYFFDKAGYLDVESTPLQTFTEISFSCWIKINSWNTSYATVFAAKNGAAASWNNLIFALLRNSTSSNLCFTISNGSNYTATNCITGTLSTGIWYNFICVYKSGIIELYQNGVLVKSYSTSIVPNFASIQNLWIGKATSTYYQTDLYINDFRIYDHALSLKQIKEISKGLVLHYPLNQNVGLGLNLVKNGFGQLGTENWTSTSNISTTELPSGHSQFKRSFFNNTTNQYIPIIEGATYKLQLYIKANTGSTALMYPTFYPYDIDKKMIHPYNVKNWFDLNTLTTLTQTLNPGDTKIYVEDLSKWNTNSGHYYNYAAIFNYQDSTGHIYATGEYTQNTPRFGNSTSAKTNLDKTNNIITLLSAYSGPVIPAGTELCASTDGSTYYYPFGALRGADYQDWTYISTNFVPGSDGSQLKVAKYIRYYTGWQHQYETGIRITNLSTLDSVVYDTSGYEHNGTASTGITCNTNSPRYNVSTQFDSSKTTYIKIQDNTWIAQGAQNMTVNLWAYMDNWTNFSHRLFSCTEGGGFNTEPGNSGYMRFPVHVYTNETQTSTTYQYNSNGLNLSDLASGWHMLTFTYDASVGTKIYVDGQLYSSYSITSYGLHFATNARLFLGCEANTANPSSPYFTGKESDFRLYYTTLSADDILQLYQTSALADKNNNFYAYEYDEYDTPQKVNITKTGISNLYQINENPNYLSKQAKSHAASSYQAYQFNLLQNLEANKTYTLQLWDVDVSHTGKTQAQTGVWVYWGGGNVNLFNWAGTTYFTNGHADYLSKTFTITGAQATHVTAVNAWLNIYNSVPSVSGTMNMSIGKWKLTKGGAEMLSNKIYYKKDSSLHTNNNFYEI